MGDFRFFFRRRHDRGRLFSFAISSTLVLICLACLSTFLFQGKLSRGAGKCKDSWISLPHKSPDVMFISIVASDSIVHSLVGVNELQIEDQNCVYRLYTSSERVYAQFSREYDGLCVLKQKKCAVDVRLQSGMRMWGDITLDDVPKSTAVVFLRDGIKFTTRAMDWLKLAHVGIDKYYTAGGRREYVGAAIGCHGEMSLSPWWSHVVGPLNTTCAFSPSRTGREDMWAFFSQWFKSRRREWISWPHIWEEDMSVPTFRRGESNSKQDRKLIKYSTRVGKNYGYVGNPYLLWERWFTRWAASYTMRVISAESNLGIRLPGAAPGTDKDGISAASDDSAKKILSTQYGDSVRIGSVWYEPFDAEFGKRYFEALQSIVAERPTMVSIAVISSQVLELTKSWLCNVKQAGFEPPHIFWITFDKESKTVLDASGVGRTIDITDALSPENMDSVHILDGQPAYWKMMLMRARLIRDLLDRGIDVFLFETDQIWLQDPFIRIGKEVHAGADVVGTLDSEQKIAGSMLLLRALLSTRRLWSEVYHRFRLSYDEMQIETKDIHSQSIVAHDETQLSALLLFERDFTQDFPVALGLLDKQAFVEGSWYTGTYTNEDAKRPVTISNNFVSGAEAKKSQAQEFGHWFLKRDNITCDQVSVRKALRYEFLQMPGRWHKEAEGD